MRHRMFAAFAIVFAVTITEFAIVRARFVGAPEHDGPRDGLIRARDARERRGARANVKTNARRTYALVVVGDSTVCGVGCALTNNGGENERKTRVADEDANARDVENTREDDRSGGPTLARTLATFVGKTLNTDVEWAALGYKGADVNALREKVVPALRERARARARASGARELDAAPDAVVIMCGVNDAKMSVVGRSSSKFRDDLRELVREIRAVVGEKCVVVIPATPLEAATLFPLPLAWFATRTNDLWDAQKRKVSELATNVVFVSKPSVEALRARAKNESGRAVASLTCADGVHPNDDGYAAWAAHIAEECAPRLALAFANAADDDR